MDCFRLREELEYEFATDTRKLEVFRDYYNEFRVHCSLDGTTQAQRAGKLQRGSAALTSYAWRQHCHGLLQTPMAD
jgi:hypothetical protein